MPDGDEIVWTIVEEHLDEAEFLVEQWRNARRSPLHTLSELAEGIEARLAAHVDGLSCNGPLALEQVVWPVIEDGAELDRVAAAALTLLDAGEFRVLEVLDEPRASTEEAEEEPVDEEPVRLAGLRELAERLDALEPDPAERTAVEEVELGPETWRQLALHRVARQLASETDEARLMELGEIRVLLSGHAPPGAAAVVEDVDEELPPEWAALTPEQRAQRRAADLEDIEQQLAVATDDEERARLQGLRLVLEEEAVADAEDLPEPVAEAEAADEPAREPELDPRIEGLALAFALSSHPELGDRIRARAAKAEGPSLGLLLGACADRGLHPGPALDRGLLHDDPVVVQAALRAAAFGERPRLLAMVETQLQHRSPLVRPAAFETAMLWGSRAAWELAQQTYKAPNAGPMRLWLACLGDERHAQALVPLLDDEALRHDVLWALGFSGRASAVEACLRWLDDDDETTRRLAGEAVAAIIGLDPEDDTLWEQEDPDAPAPGTDGDAPGENEDDLGADLVDTPEDELPLPNAAAIRKRWEQLRGGFTAGQRYILGKQVGREGPGWALPLLSCRRVDVVAREVVARSQGAGRWPVRTLALRHQQATSALAELKPQAGSLHRARR
ncbi:hypothetical protein [Paraliomyxa miuraensis]|uniref:hypothetical protein n=1 Tax=Paraliomyxa miuraensis TaxID=376150 RepID=UPI00224F2676|nr:hypothetical protein [Paraliomyxa miuraensis]MCX4240160.1 hypothetical protein [Paraliomyxa miuraensis]